MWLPFEGHWGLGMPDRSPTLNEPWRPDGPSWWPGGWVSLSLGFGGPLSPALWHQAPWEGHLRGRPTVRVSTQVAVKPEPMAVHRGVLRAEVRRLGSGSVGQVFWRRVPTNAGSLEDPACSPALYERRCFDGPSQRPEVMVSLALGHGGPNPQGCGTRPLGNGPSGADLGLGLAPRWPSGPSRGLCIEGSCGPR